MGNVTGPKRAAMLELGEQIAVEAAHMDAALHRLLTHIREFDTGCGWGHLGAQSCAHWLSWRVGWTLGTGREHVRVARRLGELTRVDEALRQGKLSYAKVRAITRVATAATEQRLLDLALVSTGAQLETICRKFRAVQRLSKASQRELDEDRRVTRRELDDGLVRIEATLRPEEAALVMAAIEQQAKANARANQRTNVPVGPEDPPAEVSAGTPRRRFDRADALVSIAQAIVRGERQRGHEPASLERPDTTVRAHRRRSRPPRRSARPDEPGHLAGTGVGTAGYVTMYWRWRSCANAWKPHFWYTPSAAG